MFFQYFVGIFGTVGLVLGLLFCLILVSNAILGSASNRTDKILHDDDSDDGFDDE